MKKLLLTLLLLFFTVSISYAEDIRITPVKTIKTTTKYFKLGNRYQFRNIKNGDIYTGTVVLYRPNGFVGQPAQIEINNFTDKNNKTVFGKITVIPLNHKKYQEYANYFTSSGFTFVRGSEIILIPDVHVFLLSETEKPFKGYVVHIKPTQSVSTTHDEIETGDKLKFITTEDVYKDGKLFIKKGTDIIGEVANLDENCWCADNAVITLKKFRFVTENNKSVTFNSYLEINGFENLKYKSKRFAQFFNYMTTFVRGKEVDIKNYDTNIDFCLLVEE